MNKPITLDIKTSSRNELLDIAGRMQKLVVDSGVTEGILHLYVPHTTAGITINENADPSVKSDIIAHLAKMIPRDANFRHSEGNSDAHIKATLTGFSLVIPISGGKLTLGIWQGIYFCEYDGPRSRKLIVSIITAS